MNLQVDRKYSITLIFPLKNHGADLCKNTFAEVYDFFKDKKRRAEDDEKKSSLEFILAVMDAAEECGVCRTIEEVSCDRDKSIASITFSFTVKVLLENFEKRLEAILSE